MRKLIVGLFLLLLVPLFPSPSLASGICPNTTQSGFIVSRQQRVANWDNLAALCTSGVSGIGAKNGSAVSVAESGSAALHKSVFTLTALSVTVTDTGGANGAQGSSKIYDFPEGIIQSHGCSYNLTTLAGSGGIVDGAALVGSLGTTAAANDNATLTTTEADWVASTAGTLTAGAGTLKSYGSLVVAGWDGHTTAVDLYLNVAVPDADVSASDTVAVSGTITCLWSSQGDY